MRTDVKLTCRSRGLRAENFVCSLRGATSVSSSASHRPVLPIEAGTWWWLFDGYTRLPGDKEHPWIFIVDYEPRRAFAHVCLRSSTQPPESQPSIEHAPHANGHEASCRLDRTAWVMPHVISQIAVRNMDARDRNCLEPDPALLDRIREIRRGGLR
jgi:hypothetical protein